MIDPVVEFVFTEEQLAIHEALIRKAEREACAQICDEISRRLAASCTHAADAAKAIRSQQ